VKIVIHQKIAKLPNKRSKFRSEKQGDLMYSDKGLESANGENYLVIFVETFPRKISIYNVKRKKKGIRDVATNFLNYLKSTS